MTDYDLHRFIKAQDSTTDGYAAALEEVKSGRKKSHWIWYVFPQPKGLGSSSTSEFYGLAGLEEATEYLNDEVLGKRLIEISKTLLQLESRNAFEIFYKDAKKVRSCMELFASIDKSVEQPFKQILNEFTF